MKPTTEKNWKCDKCSKLFVRKRNLDLHAITHETNSQVKFGLLSKARARLKKIPFRPDPTHRLNSKARARPSPTQVKPAQSPLGLGGLGLARLKPKPDSPLVHSDRRRQLHTHRRYYFRRRPSWENSPYAAAEELTWRRLNDQCLHADYVLSLSTPHKGFGATLRIITIGTNICVRFVTKI
ncbi:PR domain zinc finger protein 4 [Folsomia candida]|uniref:PR domain zinc finger protein 4 n=1 Tax=Folsomia candida TaxID=158441 RepID=A0A226DBA7_FOLCA|nr:PR domain zinc finger protein 4 [Folsomia candida]